MMYGDRGKHILELAGRHTLMHKDWMDEGAGHQAAKIANKKPGGDVKVVQISDAGHHCYLDNPKEFDQVVIDFIKRSP